MADTDFGPRKQMIAKRLLGGLIDCANTDRDNKEFPAVKKSYFIQGLKCYWTNSKTTTNGKEILNVLAPTLTHLARLIREYEKTHHLTSSTNESELTDDILDSELGNVLRRLKDKVDILEFGIDANTTNTNRTGPKRNGWAFTLSLPSLDHDTCLADFDTWCTNRDKNPAKSAFPTRQQRTKTATDTVSHNIPFLGTSTFVGRKKTLEDLHNVITQERSQVSPVALSGMGGVGKTELAIQYAQTYVRSFSGGLCWIFARRLDAPSNATIPSQIISFAQIYMGIEIPDHLKTAHDRVAYCWQHWPQGDVLLIFDDVDAYSDISPDYIPRDSRFKVLLTTRLKIDPPVRALFIDVLTRSDSLQLLSLIVSDHRTTDETQTDSLCEFLGDLPLAIELAGRYLANDEPLSVAEFLTELYERANRRKVPTHYAFEGDAQENPAWMLTARRGLDAAFDLTWERLNQPTQLVAKLIGRFEPGPILWKMVELMRETLAEEDLEDGDYAPDDLISSKHSLLLFHLVKPFDDKSYRLHPLIREFFRSKITDEEYERYGNEDEEE